MIHYKIIGIDLAKTKLHIVALDSDHRVVMKKAITRKNFIEEVNSLFLQGQVFAFEACGGSNYIGQLLTAAGHKVIALKAKDVKAYAKSMQKNDMNDALAICKAALDPNLKHVQLKTKEMQEVYYLHKTRQNVIQQRIQRSNSIMTSLMEFGFVVNCGKSAFAKLCNSYVKEAYEAGFICRDVCKEMLKDCKEISDLLTREKHLDKAIIARNNKSAQAKLLETIPGIGPINASILSNKPMASYETAKDFAASLGLVPKQSTTGGIIRLGGITKQGDRYARTMLIQAGRSIVMRSCKANPPEDDKIYSFVNNMKSKCKGFNVTCVAVANKLARIAYGCIIKNMAYKS